MAVRADLPAPPESELTAVAAPPDAAGPAPAPAWPRRVFVVVVFAVAIAGMLRRTPGQLAHRLPGDLGDSALVQWILSWGAHGLVHHPLHVFDANMFWPNPNTLAYADSLLSIAPVYGVVHAVTANWTLSWNLLWLALIGLNLGATYALTRWLTGRTDAAVFAALAAGFSAFVLGQSNHPQLQVLGLIPLGFLLFFKLLERPGPLLAVGLGAVNVAVALSSLYLAAGYAIAMVVMTAGFVLVVRGRLGRRLLLCLLLAGVVTLVAAPTVIPYHDVQQTYGRRPVDPKWGLRPRDIVRPALGSYLYGSLARDTDRVGGSSERHDFPGFSTLALGGVGLAAMGWGLRRRRPWRHSARRADPGHPDRTRYLALLTVAGGVVAALAIGAVDATTRTPWLIVYHRVRVLDGVRAPVRLFSISILALAVLAGFGLSCITRSLRRRPLRVAVAAAACVFVLAELAAPVTYTTLAQDPATLAVYRELDHRPQGVVVELPFATQLEVEAFFESPRLVWSTIDLHPRLNGYSGYVPAAYPGEAQTLNTLPAPPAWALARTLGLRYIVLHTGVQGGYAMYTDAQARAILAAMPAGATSGRYGSSYLIDLGVPSR